MLIFIILVTKKYIHLSSRDSLKSQWYVESQVPLSIGTSSQINLELRDPQILMEEELRRQCWRRMFMHKDKHKGKIKYKCFSDRVQSNTWLGTSFLAPGLPIQYPASPPALLSALLSVRVVMNERTCRRHRAPCIFSNPQSKHSYLPNRKTWEPNVPDRNVLCNNNQFLASCNTLLVHCT